jgi:hypothetical protein
MIQAWQISVLDSSNLLQFSLSSLTDSLDITPRVAVGRLNAIPPQITSTSIYLPILPTFITPDGLGSTHTSFFKPTGTVANVEWFKHLDNFLGIPFEGFNRVGSDQGVELYNVTYSLDQITVIAVNVPEPSALAVWSLVAGVFNLRRIRKKLQQLVAT